MIKVIDIFRMMLIELLIGILVWYFLSKNLQIIDFISKLFFVSEMTWKEYMKLFAFPLFVVSMNYKLGMEILNPSDKDNRKVLKEFPGYWMLKNRILYSIFVSVFILVGTILCWYNAMITNNFQFVTMIILILWSISLTTFVTIARANMEIKDVLY